MDSELNDRTNKIKLEIVENQKIPREHLKVKIYKTWKI